MKVLLVQPLSGLVDLGRWVRNCFMEALGLEYVAAATAAGGHAVSCVHPVASDGEFAELVHRAQPDVIGYSVYSYALDEALRWARSARAISPGVTNVFGGYHPSAVPLAVANAPCVDFAVAGEGERAFVELLACLERGEHAPRIGGVAYSGMSGDSRFRRAERCSDLDKLPLPRRDPAVLDRTVSRQIMYPPPSRQIAVAQVTYGRGCDHACPFCASGSIWGRKTVWRSPKAVVDELEALVHDYGTNLVFFSDVSMAADGNRLRALCEELIARDLPVHWWCMCRIDELEAQSMVLMRKAKAVTAMRWSRVCDRLSAAERCGLIVRATLMMDHPGATMDYYSRLACSMEHLPVHEIRISFCTPFPGTSMYDQQLPNACVDATSLREFTTETPIFCAGDVTRDQLLCIRQALAHRFYGSPAYESRLRHTLAHSPHLAQSFEEFLAFADSQALLPTAMIGRLRVAILDSATALGPGETAVAGEVMTPLRR